MSNWRTAFIVQGESDYMVFEHLRDNSDFQPCHYLHYLQMATEKLAKGFSSKDGLHEPPKVHSGLRKWLRTIKANPHTDLRDLCNCRNNDQFKKYIDSLQDLAEQVENLAPQLASARDKHINPEYPWRDPITDNIECPAQYSFLHLNFRNPEKASKTNKFLLLLGALIKFGKIKR